MLSEHGVEHGLEHTYELLGGDERNELLGGDNELLGGDAHNKLLGGDNELLGGDAHNNLGGDNELLGGDLAGYELLGGAAAMTAKEFMKERAKVRFPLMVQPKLDGMRMLYDSRQRRAESRGGSSQKVESLTHVMNALRAANWNGYTLDGELYVHGKNFQEIMRMVNNADSRVEYHVFDLVSSDPFSKRFETLANLLKAAPASTKAYVKLVQTGTVRSEAEAEAIRDREIAQGYEGIMLRDPKSAYSSTRSMGLLKFKRFDDAEFRVVGYKPHAGGGVVWECTTQQGKHFYVTPNNELRAQTGNETRKYVGKYLTVKFQGFSESGVPRFPIGKAFRDSYDLANKNHSAHNHSNANRTANANHTQTHISHHSMTRNKMPRKSSDSDKILNPATGRMVLKTGAIGRKLLSQAKKSPASHKKSPTKQSSASHKKSPAKKSPTHHKTHETHESHSDCGKRLTDKKYSSRGSPPYHANDCKGVTKRGNDGLLYESKSNRNGVYSWKKV
jgi:DNA ligase-1